MARLAFALLGTPQITLDGSPPRFESDKVRALLIYLAANARRAYARETLVDLLWPELPARAARHNLSQALFNLRRAIGDQTAAPPFLRITRETIQFNPAADYSLDLDAFTTLLAACDAHGHRHIETCAACAQRLADAVALYRGDLLAELTLADSVGFDEWALLEREHYRRRMMRALTLLATFHEQRGAYARAGDYARRQLALDSWCEEAYRRMMRMLMLAGQRRAALEEYERCRKQLAQDLGVEPEAETIALYRRILEPDALSRGEELLALPSERRHNLPPPPTRFVGREDELAQLADLLANGACRLLTIAGPGGIGKTRLALQAAAQQIEAFAAGVCYVPLAGLRQPEHLASAIADALELPSSPDQAAAERLLAGLRDQEVLLVLDNLEHLLAGVDVVTMILARAPRVTILATSRERLNVQHEWLFEPGGLPVPAADSPPAVNTSGAVELFVESARRVQASFAPSPEDLVAIVHICRLVEGLPLAIELAASWTRLLSCAEIAAEIGHSLEFLTTSLRDVPPRHRSLRAVFDHSWALLDDDERRTFSRLSVFRGGFRREQAESVASASLQQLAALMDKSLLHKTIVGRYDLHELARQYAATRLQMAGAEAAVRDRHRSAMLALADQAEAELTGPNQEAWLARLEEERDNLREALRSAIEQGAPETALRLAGALWRFWDMHGYFAEARRWLEQVLGLSICSVTPAVRLKVLNGAGTLARRQSDYARASTFFEAGLELSRAAGERFWTAVLLNGLGLVARRQGKSACAAGLFEESLALSRELANWRGVAAALGNLGSLARSEGDLSRAAALQEECLTLSRRLGDKRGIAEDLNNLAVVLDAQGRRARATELQQESLALYRGLGDQYGIALLLYNLGSRARQAGALDEAGATLAESLAIYHGLGEAVGCIECLEQLAAIAAGQDGAICAATLLGAAEQQREILSAPRPPSIQVDFDCAAGAIRSLLAPEVFDEAWAHGRAMTLGQALAAAAASALSQSPA